MVSSSPALLSSLPRLTLLAYHSYSSPRVDRTSAREVPSVDPSVDDGAVGGASHPPHQGRDAALPQLVAEGEGEGGG